MHLHQEDSQQELTEDFSNPFELLSFINNSCISSSAVSSRSVSRVRSVKRLAPDLSNNFKSSLCCFPKKSPKGVQSASG